MKYGRWASGFCPLNEMSGGGGVRFLPVKWNMGDECPFSARLMKYGRYVAGFRPLNEISTKCPFKVAKEHKSGSAYVFKENDWSVYA